MKGGTAINLFVQDMPRLSVDIDVVYIRRDATRDQALQEITTDYHGSFVGMTEEEASLATLLETRERLRQELPARMTRQQRQFLIGLAQAHPDWMPVAM